MSYYDPDAFDPLEAEKATLPIDVQRRMWRSNAL